MSPTSRRTPRAAARAATTLACALAALPAAALLAGCQDAPATPLAPPPRGDATADLTTAARTTKAKGTILFVRGADIYSMNANGTGATPVTTDGAGYSGPQLSPDGTRIAYSLTVGGVPDVYVMNADGTGGTRLTQSAGSNNYPSWSPDGTKIAFSSNRDGDWELYVMDPNGGAQTRLTTSAGVDLGPVWSPDGTRIAFASDRAGSGSRDVYVMNADGTNPVRLTTNPMWDQNPAWSPDGSKIAYTCNLVFNQTTHDTSDEICTVDVASKAVVALTSTTTVNESGPTWSPDGTRIAFSSGGRSASDLEIYTIGSAGGRASQLTHNTVSDTQPFWTR